MNNQIVTKNKNEIEIDNKIAAEIDNKIAAEIEKALFDRGADIVRFVDISHLPESQTQGFAKAVVFCMALSKAYILAKYNGEMTEKDEFADKEHEADVLADWLANWLRQKGYGAYSQSEESNWQNSNFDGATRSSRLPHKTLARLAGLGYIGKNNLLITERYGCAIIICTVLTDAPFTAEPHSIDLSKCGNCDICKQICTENAILGNEWSEATSRDGVIDVSKCTCSLRCMVYCPHTLKYANS